MLEFCVGYCTLPEIHRVYTEIVKQLQIFSDNLWAKNLRLKVYALFYVYSKKITQCMFFCTENCDEVREKLPLQQGRYVHFMLCISYGENWVFLQNTRLCSKQGVSCRVLNSWKSLEICPAIFQTWKIELKSRKMMKSLEFVSKLHQAGFICNFVFVLVKSYPISPVCSASWKKLCLCVV